MCREVVKMVLENGKWLIYFEISLSIKQGTTYFTKKPLGVKN